MGSFSILVSIVCMTYYQTETNGLTCFSCLDITHPRFCKHVENCDSGEICGLEKLVYPSGETTFNVGCFQSKTCYDNITKSTVNEKCRHCCSTSMCNDNGCGERGLTLSRGPICYQCDGALSMNECKTVSICGQNQFCYIEAQHSFDGKLYTTRCQNEKVCDVVSGGVPIVGKKRREMKIHLRSSVCSRCCLEDLCNINCWKSNVTITGTSEVTTKTTAKAITYTTANTIGTSTWKGYHPRDCSYIYFYKPGVFTIYPKGDRYPIRVYCMILYSSKWTVIQRRVNGSLDFDRTWNEYKEGFGSVYAEYWLGNEYIHALTVYGANTVYILLEDHNGTSKYALYSYFHVGDENSKYLLNVTGYRGNAGNSLDSRMYNSEGNANGMKFTTKDQDNDMESYNCARNSNGGWWYNACDFGNLNLKDHPRWNVAFKGVVQKSMMMIRHY